MKVLLATDGSDAALRASRELGSMLVPERDSVRVVTVLSLHALPLLGHPQRAARRRGPT